jgi:hypothetical protein
MKIYLATDPNCWTLNHIARDIMGNTERFFITLRNWLIQDGHRVHDSIISPPEGETAFDIAIHSNNKNDSVKAKKHICRAGSWHSDAGYADYDIRVVISSFMADQLKVESATIIPAPVLNDINFFERRPIPKRIVCTSNFARHIEHTELIIEGLIKAGVGFEFHICGGNKLYNQSWPDPEINRTNCLVNHGPLSLLGTYDLLRTADLWVYPNLTDNSETFCVSALEAMTMGILTIVPYREPFISVHKQALHAKPNVDSFVNVIRHNLLCDRSDPVYEGMQCFSEDVVKEQWLSLVRQLCY